MHHFAYYIQNIWWAGVVKEVPLQLTIRNFALMLLQCFTQFLIGTEDAYVVLPGAAIIGVSRF